MGQSSGLDRPRGTAVLKKHETAHATCEGTNKTELYDSMSEILVCQASFAAQGHIVGTGQSSVTANHASNSPKNQDAYNDGGEASGDQTCQAHDGKQPAT